MSDIPIINNPLGWAQLQLVGGWRRFWALASLYAGVILFVSIVIYRGAQPNLTISQFAAGALTLLIFVQAGLLFLVGTNQIRRAIQRDFTSDMITSHRLTAMTGHAAVLGYLTGAIAQVAAMTLVNWLACTLFAFMAGPGPAQSVYAPTVLFVAMGLLAVTCWTFGILIALSTRGKAAVTSLLVVLAVASNLTITAALPGLYLVLSFARVGMITQAKMLPIDEAFLFVSMILQAYLASIFFLAAARKYHRDDVQAFTLPLAYVLLGLCTLACAAALRFWRPDYDVVLPFFEFAADPTTQKLVTLSSLALLACLPIACAAKQEARWSRRASKDAHFTPPRPRRYYESAIVSTLVVFAVLIPVMGPVVVMPFFTYHVNGLTDFDAARAVSVVIAFFLAMLTMSGLMRYCYSVITNGAVSGSLFVFLLWFMPLIVDLTLEVAYERPTADPKSIYFVISPIGTWIAALKNQSAPIAGGLAVQFAIAVLGLMLARRAKGASAPAV